MLYELDAAIEGLRCCTPDLPGLIKCSRSYTKCPDRPHYFLKKAAENNAFWLPLFQRDFPETTVIEGKSSRLFMNLYIVNSFLKNREIQFYIDYKKYGEVFSPEFIEEVDSTGLTMKQ